MAQTDIDTFSSFIASLAVNTWDSKLGGNCCVWYINHCIFTSLSLWSFCCCCLFNRLKTCLKPFLVPLLETQCWRNHSVVNSGYVYDRLVATLYCVCIWLYCCYRSLFNACRKNYKASTQLYRRSTNVAAGCWSNGSTSLFSHLGGQTEPRYVYSHTSN